MKNVLIKKYLEHLHKAYEAERKEDYEARRYHIMVSSMLLRQKQKLTNKENQNDSM